jgi:hypothetical protein
MREEITCLGFAITFHDASCLPPLLSWLNDRLLEMIALGGMSLSGSQANEIVKEMLNIDVHGISFFLKKDYCPVVFCTFQHSLQESSVHYSSFYCEPGDWISTEALQSICTGIICLLVRVLVLSGLKVWGDNVKQVHEILAEMILDLSLLIKAIQIVKVIMWFLLVLGLKCQDISRWL